MNKIYTAAVALKLELSESATESEVLAKMDLLLGYKTANEQLRTEKEQMTLASITTAVQTAITDRRIPADKKDHFIELGKKVGLESLTLTFESMTPIAKPMELINRGGGAPSSTEYKTLSEVPAAELMALRSEDKETYMKLYKAEYGVDCKIE